jgi:hypothetical protein
MRFPGLQVGRMVHYLDQDIHFAALITGANREQGTANLILFPDVRISVVSVNELPCLHDIPFDATAMKARCWHWPQCTL